MGKRKYFLDEKKVIDLHLNGGMSLQDIAKSLDVSRKVIRTVFKRNKVPVNKRSKSTTEKLSEINLLRLDEKEIIRLYAQEGKSIYQIADKFGVSFCVIRHRLVKNSIQIRPHKMTEEGRQKLRSLYLDKTIDELYGNEKADEIRNKISKCKKGVPHTLEHNLKVSLAQTGKIVSLESRKKMSRGQLKRKERDGSMVLLPARIKMSLAHLGKKLPPLTEETKKKQSETKKRLFAEGKLKVWNVGLTKSDPRIKKYVDKLLNRVVSESTKLKMSISKKGLKRPPMSKELAMKISLANKGKPKSLEHRKKLSCLKQGIKLEEWTGWARPGPYSDNWTTSFKNLIRNRDNQVCMNCGKHREQMNKSLDVHHINSDKLLSIPENLISLCNVCHLLTQQNKEYWQKIFQEKLSKLYGYQYSEDGKIVVKLNSEVII